MGRVVAVLAAAGALLCGGCVARPEVLVGAVYPTGGGQGPGGVEEYRGVLLAAERASARGGERIRVVLEPADSADAAPEAVARLVHRGARVIVGSYGSTISRPAAAAAQRLGALFWETGAVGEVGMAASGGERFFRFPPTGGTLGREAVRFVVTRLAPAWELGRPARFAVVYVDDVYGRAVAGGALEEIRASGSEVSAELPYALASVDYDALARRVAAARSDALVVAAYLDDGVEIRRAMLRNQVPLRATIGTSSSYCMPAFGQRLGADAVGVFASDKPDGDVVATSALSRKAAEELRWARRTYRARYGGELTAAALSGFAAGVALFEYVLPRARSLDPAGVEAAALRTRLPRGSLPNGSGLSFAPPGHPEAGANLRAQSVIWQWVAPGKRAVVWPPAYATAGVRA